MSFTGNMILSGTAIEQAVRDGSLSIEPFSAANLKPASYVFTLGEKLWLPVIPHPSPPLSNGRETYLDSRKDVELEEVLFPADGYTLAPGGFVIGRTREHVKLNGKYMMQLDTRSSLAQMGLNVTQGSSWAEPNTDNSFALEISNQGTIPVKLYPGIRIARGIFFQSY